MRDNRGYLNIKAGAMQRYILWHYMASVTNHIRVTEFPKSGGTWLCQMLAALLNLPFPRNQAMTWRQGIFHSHYAGPSGNTKTILLVRDGRDVMVSAYYHFIVGHDLNPSFLTKQWRKKLGAKDFQNIEKHLPVFINIFFTHFKVGGLVMNWSSYIDSFDLNSPYIYVVKYEDLLQDCVTTMHILLNWLNYSSISEERINKVVAEFSFQNITGRSAGDEDSSQFLRKGIAGDWKNVFTEEAKLLFENWAKPQLKILEYE
ncbi:MAG: hypothetical protein ACI9FN_002926 [Saprospiraceae bacterium]|jgi:hypothetical protein